MGRQGRGKEAETHPHPESRRGKGEQEPSSLAGAGGKCASNLLGLSLQHPLSLLRAPGPQVQQKAMVPTPCSHLLAASGTAPPPIPCDKLQFSTAGEGAPFPPISIPALWHSVSTS